MSEVLNNFAKGPPPIKCCENMSLEWEPPEEGIYQITCQSCGWWMVGGKEFHRRLTESSNEMEGDECNHKT